MFKQFLKSFFGHTYTYVGYQTAGNPPAIKTGRIKVLGLSATVDSSVPRGYHTQRNADGQVEKIAIADKVYNVVV